MQDMERYDRLSAISQLASGIVHEIKNPLTAIKGFLQLAKQRLPKAPSAETLDLLMEEIDRVEVVIRTFSALAHPGTSARKAHSIGKLVEDVYTLLYSQAVLKNVRMEISTDAADREIYVDGAKIKQVLINLIKNAIEAVDKGGIISIEGRFSAEEKMAVFTVTDDGPGIPCNILQSLGTPYVTTKPEGTGIGLTICYDIVKEHGGTVDVKSSTGEGTTFIICIPASIPGD